MKKLDSKGERRTILIWRDKDELLYIGEAWLELGFYFSRYRGGYYRNFHRSKTKTSHNGRKHSGFHVDKKTIHGSLMRFI